MIVAEVRGDLPEAMANAYLMAASKDLLDACRLLLTYLEDGTTGDIFGPTLQGRLRQAIGKAKGRL